MSNVVGGCSPPHSDEGYYHPQSHRTSAREFFTASPKAESVVTKPKAKERLSDHRRFILHRPKTETYQRVAHRPMCLSPTTSNRSRTTRSEARRQPHRTRCVIFFAHTQQQGESLHRTKNKENRHSAEGQPPVVRWLKTGMTLFS
jgi:hypothetical protein